MTHSDDLALADRIGTASQDIFVMILNERFNQEKKWGQQNHPSVLVHPRGNAPRTPAERCRAHGIPDEEATKGTRARMAKEGHLTWTDIALEELAEAVSEPNDKLRRIELIQLAAVIVAWIECIDRRTLDA